MEILIPKGKYKDLSGERIHWEKPYFDPALRQDFKTEEQKRDFMHKHKIISAGSSDSNNPKLWKKYKQCKYEEAQKDKKKGVHNAQNDRL